jgi:hypothetical protein
VNWRRSAGSWLHLHRIHEVFLAMLDQGFVPAGEEGAALDWTASSCTSKGGIGTARRC